MKKYAVCGLGNALVDYDFEVSDATLTRLNIEKGVMTLIDKHAERVLLEELDGIKHVKACGGSAANTIITVQQLGGNTFYSCKLADDLTGDFYFEDMRAHGVDSNMTVQNREQGITGKCIAMITPDAERTMHTFLGITADLGVNEVNEEAIVNSEYLYMEGYLVASPSALEAALKAVRIAKEANVKVSLSLSDLNMVRHFKNELQEIIGDGIDLLFANETEALYYCESTNIENAADILLQKSKVVAITRGDKGVMVAGPGRKSKIEAYPVHAIDTIGAGDIFAGAFLSCMIDGYDMEMSGRVACFAASRVVNKFGPRLDDSRAEDVRGFIKTHQKVSVSS